MKLAFVRGTVDFQMFFSVHFTEQNFSQYIKLGQKKSKECIITPKAVKICTVRVSRI